MRGWNFETSLKKMHYQTEIPTSIAMCIKSQACLDLEHLCFSRSKTFINFSVSDQ